MNNALFHFQCPKGKTISKYFSTPVERSLSWFPHIRTWPWWGLFIRCVRVVLTHLQSWDVAFLNCQLSEVFNEISLCWVVETQMSPIHAQMLPCHWLLSFLVMVLCPAFQRLTLCLHSSIQPKLNRSLWVIRSSFSAYLLSACKFQSPAVSPKVRFQSP